jgi:hypothetical protein
MTDDTALVFASNLYWDGSRWKCVCCCHYLVGYDCTCPEDDAYQCGQITYEEEYAADGDADSGPDDWDE